MKKIVLAVLVILSSYFIFSTSVYGYEIIQEKDYLYSHIVNDDSYFYEDEKYVIIGNEYDINLEDVTKLKNSNVNKELFIYFIDEYRGNIKSYKDMKAIRYYNDMGEVKTASLSTTSVDKETIKEEIYQFFIEELSANHFTEFNITNQSNEFKPVKGYFGKLVHIDKPYGYVIINYEVLKFRTNETSSLWMIRSAVGFTPGYVAFNNDEKEFEKYKNGSGYLHLEAVQPIFEESQSYSYPGGIPHFKDAFPVNQPSKVTISSSFVGGLTLGYSWKNGFSTNGISTGTDFNAGLNISYGYSKTYERQNPRMSTQISPSRDNEYQWTYDYAEKYGAIETHNMDIGYIYEQNNSGPGHYLSENDIAFEHQIKMNVHKQFLLVHDTKTINKTFYVSIHR